MELYPHNKEAYDKVMAHYNSGAHRACVLHATGTGKAHIGGAVASHFKKVLIVAPNNYVLAQAASVTPHADCVTYALIGRRSQLPQGYELIWLDEFHRAGALSWMPAVERLLAQNPKSKVLGTTATSFRSLEHRDMADEMFENDVVSEIDLPEAWSRKILRVPKYVIGVVTMNGTQADYRRRIAEAKYLDDRRKEKASAMLDNIVKDWSKSYGVDSILRKYLTPNIRKMIVFAQTISKLDEIRRSLPLWFSKAGIRLAGVYTIHSAMGNAESQMRAFKEDDCDGVKVLVSVDMLNEGVHVEQVDAVMLLRTTVSKNLYLQQIGRCFSIGQKNQPVVLDLADNLSNACGYEGVFLARERYNKSVTLQKGGEGYDDEFLIVDTLKETREVMDMLNREIAIRHSYTFEDIVAIAARYQDYHEFRTREINAYNYARKRGWLEKVCSHMGHEFGKITLEECREKALLCKSRNEFRNRFKKHYLYSCRSGHHEEICAHMSILNKSRTKEECIADIESCGSLKEFRERFQTTYNYVLSKGWIEMFAYYKKPWEGNKQYCVDFCKRFASRKEIREANASLFNHISTQKWQNECFAHIQKEKRYTKEECIEKARECKTLKEFRTRFKGFYNACWSNKWLDDIKITILTNKSL